MSEHLDNAPLVEALLELKWALGQDDNTIPQRDPAYPTIIGLLYNLVNGDYPYIEALQQASFPAEFIPHLPTHRFRTSENEWPLLQIGPGISTLNYTASYNWESFHAAALKLATNLMTSYRNVVSKPPRLHQATLRYINAIPFEFTNQDVCSFLKNKLHVTLEFPALINETLGSCKPEHLNLQVRYRIAKPSGMGTLNIGRGEKKGVSTLVWDLALSSIDADSPDLSDLTPWLNDAHSILKSWFLTLVQGEMLEGFKGVN